MSRTVIFEVKSTIGYCHVEIDDDTLPERLLVTEAKRMIADNGLEEPSRGLHFHAEDNDGDHTLILKNVKFDD